MAKGRKSKGKRRGGKKKSKKGRRSGHKPGVAESVGIAYTGLKVAKFAVPELRSLMKQPSFAGAETWATNAWWNTKANAEPALVGLVVSNMDKLPIVGKMVRPLKRKADGIIRRYVGMNL